MTSIRSLLKGMAVVLVISLSAQAASTKTDDERDRLFQERTYQGKPIMHWLKAIRDRNEEMISRAFDAIRSLGPDAWVAVPDLIKVVEAPFTPIVIGKDSYAAIASKLYDIAIRTEAMDTLAFIGESASPATMSLVRWALTPRVVPGTNRNIDDHELFIELVTLDAEQRMRVAGAVAQFGRDSFPIVATLLSSPDAAKRKLAVAILNQDALPIAAELLRSRDCSERRLGFLILKDLELIVSSSNLDELQKRLLCDAN